MCVRERIREEERERFALNVTNGPRLLGFSIRQYFATIIIGAIPGLGKLGPIGELKSSQLQSRSIPNVSLSTSITITLSA